MSKIKGLKINTAKYNLKNGKTATIAVLMYLGEGDPKKMLDLAVHDYVGNNGFYELIDAHLDNPWMRVVISNINEMEQDDFDSAIHTLKPNLQ